MSTTVEYSLPTTTRRTLAYAPCQYCGRDNFGHVNHRRNHVAKCQSEAFADMAAHAVLDAEDEGLADLLPATMIAAAHHRTAGDAEIARRNAAGAAARLARYGVQGYAGEEI